MGILLPDKDPSQAGQKSIDGQLTSAGILTPEKPVIDKVSPQEYSPAKQETTPTEANKKTGNMPGEINTPGVPDTSKSLRDFYDVSSKKIDPEKYQSEFSRDPDTGKILRRQVVYHTNTSKKKELTDDMNMINFSMKPADSYAGIDINYGSSFDDTIKVFNLLSHSGLLGVEELTYYNRLQELAPKLSEDPTAGLEYQDIFAKLKVALADKGSRYEGSLYSKLGQAASSDPNIKLINNLQDGVYKLVTLKSKTGEDLYNEYNKMLDDVDNVMSVNFVDIESIPAESPKTKMLADPWYAEYVKMAYGDQPDVMSILQEESHLAYLGPTEKKVISEIREYSSEIQDAYNKYKDLYGYDEAKRIFGTKNENGLSYMDLLDLAYLKTTATMLDDIVASSNDRTGILSFSSPSDNLEPVTLDNNTKPISNPTYYSNSYSNGYSNSRGATYARFLSGVSQDINL